MDLSSSCLNGDNCACQIHKGTVILCLSLPAYSQTAKVVVPAVCALDDPASRFAANTTNQRRLTAAANVWLHTALTCLFLGVVVVVALVQADVLGTSWSARSVDRHRIECGAHHPLVVYVGTGQRDGEGNPAPVGQNMALGAEFSAISGIGTREVPPFGAFTEALSSDAHSRSRPHLSW